MWLLAVLVVCPLAVVTAAVFLGRVIETAAQVTLSRKETCLGFLVVACGSLAIVVIVHTVQWVSGTKEWSRLIGGGLGWSLLAGTTVWLSRERWQDFFGYLLIVPLAILHQLMRVCTVALFVTIFVQFLGGICFGQTFGQSPLAGLLSGGLAFWMYYAFGDYDDSGASYSAPYASSDEATIDYDSSAYQTSSPSPSYTPPSYTASPVSSSPSIGNWDANTYGAAQTGRQNGTNL